MKSSQKYSVAENWVINASPVIALAKVGKEDLLNLLPKKSVLPEAVVQEILLGEEKT